MLGEARGYADVFKRDHFAWEYKAPGRNLDTALKQLLTYALALSNPPFLGDRKMTRELGEDYTFTLRKVYEGRVPGGADLVCYWFERARTAIDTNGLGAAGLVATNSIRGGANRRVLEGICSTTRIYEAWSDEGWVNEGLAVRVSLIAFGHASQAAQLDGVPVDAIAADLSARHASGATANLTLAVKLAANAVASFIGTQKNGPFDVSGETARKWLSLPNPNGLSNFLVVAPVCKWYCCYTSARRRVGH